MGGWGMIVMMFFVGFVVQFQAVVNSALSRYVAHPLQAAVVSFTGGFLVLTSICLISGIGLPSISRLMAAPKITLIGGFLGAIFVLSVILIVPKLGVAKVAVASLCGQVVFSIMIDHFGFLGVPQQSIEAKRLIGAGMVMAGLVLISSK